MKSLEYDIDTVYTLQQKDHKILVKHSELLNDYTNKLNTLIFITNTNQNEHMEFDKRISILETLIS